MSALQNTLLNTLDCIGDTRYPQIMQLQAITLPLSVLKERNLRLPTKRAFEGKALVLCDTTFDFA